MTKSQLVDFKVLPAVAMFGVGIGLGMLLSRWLRRKRDYEDILAEESEESFTDIGHFELKLVLVVQNGLKMGKGKIAAQCSHASVISYKLASKSQPRLLNEWERTGQRKVVVKVEDEDALLEVAHAAKKAGLVVSIVTDAGKTQIPTGSRTVVGVGPGPEDIVDSVTGHLKLL